MIINKYFAGPMKYFGGGGATLRPKVAGGRIKVND